MRERSKSWPKFVRVAALGIAAAAVLACSHVVRTRMGETFTMGDFHLRVESATAEDRRYQGVPLDVEIRLSCDGGNRFDRMDLAEALSKKGRVYFRTEGGWRERLYLLSRGDDARALVAHAYPPQGSKGYVLTLRNPFGKPDQIEVDLGR